MRTKAIRNPFGDGTLVHVCAAAAFLAASAPNMPLLAQSLKSPETVEKIVGSEVKEEETQTALDADAIIAAIGQTVENTARVRKLTNLKSLDIVYVSDAAATEGGPPPEIAARLDEHKDEIKALRQEIEGNAMLYHALDSRQVQPANVLAIAFPDRDNAIIYAAAKRAD